LLATALPAPATCAVIGVFTIVTFAASSLLHSIPDGIPPLPPVVLCASGVDVEVAAVQSGVAAAAPGSCCRASGV
jgi:hypothetical protein